MGGYDAIVVGARCAGSVLARRLAGAGWRVLLVDRASFPSDTVSTHFLFPNTLERLARIGVLERLRAGHDIPRLLWGWRVLGHEVTGAFTPVAGEDRLTCIRRVTPWTPRWSPRPWPPGRSAASASGSAAWSAAAGRATRYAAWSWPAARSSARPGCSAPTAAARPWRGRWDSPERAS